MILYDLDLPNPASTKRTLFCHVCDYTVDVERTSLSVSRANKVMNRAILLPHWQEEHIELFNIALLADEGVYVSYGKLTLNLLSSFSGWEYRRDVVDKL